MSTKPLPEDVLVNSGGFWARCALAVSRNDAEAALQLLRDMAECEGKIFLTIIEPLAPRAATPPLRSGEAAFAGRPMLAKFPGRCTVCAGGFGVDSPILYDSASRRAAHDACGEEAA